MRGMAGQDALRLQLLPEGEVTYSIGMLEENARLDAGYESWLR
jgi:hypothetical protein